MYINLNCSTCFKNIESRGLRSALLSSDTIYLDSYFDKATDFDDISCICGNKIKENDNYTLRENFLEIAYITLSESISKKIEYCSLCEGAIIDHILHENDRGKGEYDLSEQDMRDLENLGTPIPLLISGSLPSKATNKLITMLSCQNCGFGFNKYDSEFLVEHSEFSFYDGDRAYTEQQIEEINDRLNYFKIRDFTSDYEVTLQEDDLLEFGNFL